MDRTKSDTCHPAQVCDVSRIPVNGAHGVVISPLKRRAERGEVIRPWSPSERAAPESAALLTENAAGSERDGAGRVDHLSIMLRIAPATGPRAASISQIAYNRPTSGAPQATRPEERLSLQRPVRSVTQP
jgi:hypothetical protein